MRPKEQFHPGGFLRNPTQGVVQGQDRGVVFGWGSACSTDPLDKGVRRVALGYEVADLLLYVSGLGAKR